LIRYTHCRAAVEGPALPPRPIWIENWQLGQLAHQAQFSASIFAKINEVLASRPGKQLFG
jgi:hypothetical protein